MLCTRAHYRRFKSYLQTDVHNASIWYNNKKLNSLNIDQSGCMLLGTRQTLHNIPSVEIILDVEVLQMYECTYIGVDLMNNLSW